MSGTLLSFLGGDSENEVGNHRCRLRSRGIDRKTDRDETEILMLIGLVLIRLQERKNHDPARGPYSTLT